MQQRGGRAGGPGRGQARGASSGAGGGRPAQGNRDKAPILDLSRYLDKQLRIKFAGGREIVGTLKGYDQLLNLVLDEVEESLEAPSKTYYLACIGSSASRSLGLVIIRGTALVVINPKDGLEEIANPFQQDA